jgi:hypothetical protein
MEETRFQTGDAAKVADTYSGQLLRLGYSFNNLRIAVGNAIIPIAQRVLPVINAIVEGFTRFFNVIAQVSSALFGSQVDTAKTAAKASKAETGLAKAVDKAGKAAKGALAGFDELNVLTKETAESAEIITEGLSASTDAGLGLSLGKIELPEGVQRFIDGVRDALKELAPYVADVKESWNDFKDAVKEFMSDPLVQAAGKFLVTFVEEAAKAGVKVFLLGISGALKFLAGNIKATLGWWQVFFGVITKNANKIKSGFETINEGNLDMADGLAKMGMAVAEGNLGTTLIRTQFELLPEEAQDGIKKWFTEDVAPWFTKEKWAELFNQACEGIEQGYNDFLAWWNSTALVKWYNEYVAPWFTKKKWEDLLNTAQEGWKSGWKSIKDWWAETINKWWSENVVPWFTKEKWIEMMTGMVEGWKQTFKNAVAVAIGILNDLISWINEKFNIEWDSFTIGTKTFPGGSIQLIHMDPIEIPWLATGAVIPPNARFAAILGDQTMGRNLEAPEGLIRQIMREELADLIEGGEITLNNIVTLDGEVVFRNQQKVARRRGVNLIKGVT